MPRITKRIGPTVLAAGLVTAAAGPARSDVLTVGPGENLAGPITVGGGPQYAYSGVVLDGGNVSGGATATTGGSADVQDGNLTGGLNGDHDAQLAISGGTVDDVNTTGSATLSFTGGAVTGTLTAGGQSHVTISGSGGDVGAIKVDPNAILDVIDAAVSAPNGFRSAGTVDVGSGVVGGPITTTGGTLVLSADASNPTVGSTVGDVKAGNTAVSILDGSAVASLKGTGGDRIVVDNSIVGPIGLAPGDALTIENQAVVGRLTSAGGTITLEGGGVDSIHGDDATVVRVVGSDLTISGSPGAYVVNGTLEDGTVVHNLNVDVTSTGQILLIPSASVPEPPALATGLLALAGALGLRAIRSGKPF